MWVRVSRYWIRLGPAAPTLAHAQPWRILYPSRRYKPARIHRADTPSVRPDTKGQEPCQLKKKKEKAKKVLQLARAPPSFPLLGFNLTRAGRLPESNASSSNAMSNETLPAQIEVSAQAWRAYVIAKAKATSAAKEAETLRAALGLPETETLVALLGATEKDGGSAVLIDGNGTPVAKLSLSYRAAYAVKAGWVSRLS